MCAWQRYTGKAQTLEQAEALAISLRESGEYGGVCVRPAFPVGLGKQLVWFHHIYVKPPA